MRSRLAGVALLLGLFGILGPAVAPAASQADVSLQKIGQFAQPTSVVSTPGDPNDIFVTERLGTVQELNHGTKSLFLDLPALGLMTVDPNTEFERGLFSIAFPPDYATSHLFYVAYSSGPQDAGTPGPERLDEFRTDASGNVIPGSDRQVLSIDHTQSIHHWGGHITFGPDGYLYMSTGDGDEGLTSQDTGTLLGKILRIDPRQYGPYPYTVPTDNPFYGPTPGRDEVWSYGLRNPWQFSFDRLTGALVIGDVGRNTREEIDYAEASGGRGRGVNYGWPCREGLVAQPDPAVQTSCTGLSGFTDPVFDYDHTPIDGGPQRRAITGGYVDRDPGLTDLTGRYLYADLYGDQLRSISLAGPAASGDRLELSIPHNPEAFGEDSCGRIYIAFAYDDVYRITGSTPTDCSPVGPPPPPPNPTPEARTLTLSRSGHGRVPAHKKMVLRIAASGCMAGGATVTVTRGGRKVRSVALNGSCKASFGWNVAKRSAFRAEIGADSSYLAARSKPLVIKVRRAPKRR